MQLTLILLREARDSVSVWLKRWLADQFDSLSRRNACSFSLSSHPNTVALKRSYRGPRPQSAQIITFLTLKTDNI